MSEDLEMDNSTSMKLIDQSKSVIEALNSRWKVLLSEYGVLIEDWKATRPHTNDAEYRFIRQWKVVATAVHQYALWAEEFKVSRRELKNQVIPSDDNVGPLSGERSQDVLRKWFELLQHDVTELQVIVRDFETAIEKLRYLSKSLK